MTLSEAQASRHPMMALVCPLAPGFPS